MKKTLVCIDRDGTLIYDSKDHLFLGRDDGWESKVRILPRVVVGLKLLNTIPDASVYMITNQVGVAISDYSLLTNERAHEVCKYVIDKIKNLGVNINGYFLCPHATLDYVKTKLGVNFDKKLVHKNCKCLKPALGMVFNALKAENITPENTDIYFIGDRASDVQTALNINGTGILIPFEGESNEEKKIAKLVGQERVHVVGNLLKAAELIFKQKRD